MDDIKELLNRVKFDLEQTSPGLIRNISIFPDEAQDQASHDTSSPARTPVDSLSSQLRVLLINENTEERHACRKALQQYSDFTTDLVEVVNGEEGLFLASQQQFDCILLDYQLPDMSGMEFLERLAELIDGMHLPILKLVTSDKPQMVAEALKRGVHNYLIKDSDGHYLELLPTLIRRLLENQCISHEKHQIEAMYRTLVEHIPAVTYIASLRHGSHLLYVSPQIEKLGYPCDMWISNPDLRFLCIYEEDRQLVEKVFADSCASGENFCCKYRMQSRDGKLHWFLDEARVIREHNGQAMFFQGVMQDITDMKVMESELQVHRYYLEQRVQDRTEQLEKRLATLESCNSELCNQLEKQRMHSAYPGKEEISQLSETFNNMLTQIQLNEAELEKLVQSRTRELEIAKREAESANQAKSQLLANITHEIRTPMNAIVCLIELCLNSSLSPKQREYLQKAEIASRSLIAIIDDTLDFSKMEAGKMQLANIPFILEESLEQIFATMAELAARKGLKYNYPPIDKRHAVIGDPLRLRQVLINLIGNAIKFTEHGEVSVNISKLSQNERQVCFQFCIIDTGIGISKEQQSRLFHNFAQGDSSVARFYGGTGLGLVISKQLIEQMGGSISMESQENFGTKFVFSIMLGVSQACPNLCVCE